MALVMCAHTVVNILEVIEVSVIKVQVSVIKIRIQLHK